MRTGTNPEKKISRASSESPPLSICIIVHIPLLGGYWRESLDILKECIKSIIQNTEGKFEFLVFDNGSCFEVREFLSNLCNKGQIDLLFLSNHNIGKKGAWNILFNSVRTEFTVYADSDVYFYKNWLAEHLKVYSTFKNVGMVSGLSVRERASFATKSTLMAAKHDKDSVVTVGKFLDSQVLMDFRRSVGKDPADYETGPLKDIYDTLIERGGVRTLIGATHFQFMSPTSVLRQMLPFSTSKKIGDESELDQSMDNAGYLRLSTVDRYVHHMGNSLNNDPWVKQIGRTPTEIKTRHKGFFYKLRSRKFIRRQLTKLYDWLSRS